jgi:hypothetical protein
MRDDLIQLGFSLHEADIYIALLETGQTGAGEIIKRTGLHRNIVYDTLDKLIARKLVVKVFRKNIALFQITDPKRIVEHEKSKLYIAESLLPKIEEKAEVVQDIIIFDGLEGFRTFNLYMLDEMAKGSSTFGIGSVGDRWYELMGDKYAQYERKRLKKKIWWKLIAYAESEKDKQLISAGKLVDIRIAEEPFNPSANMLIYNDKVCLQTLIEPYSVIEIKNSALVESYLNYFNALWERGKKA